MLINDIKRKKEYEFTYMMQKPPKKGYYSIDEFNYFHI